MSCCFGNINLLLIFQSSPRSNVSVLKRHADEVKGFHAKPLITEITHNNLVSSDFTRTRVCNIYDLSYTERITHQGIAFKVVTKNRGKVEKRFFLPPIFFFFFPFFGGCL